MKDVELMRIAGEARQKAYAPYSGFCVGAALLGESGKVYTGCNIENTAFSPTVCAERTAIFKAVSEGERSFSAIAVTGGKAGDAPSYCTPCGVCRQVLAEFCGADFRVLLGNATDVRVLTLGELLPEAFGGEMK
ncbi:MAG: cytidine deaminase [Clostridia bacterium]|nr:cytidine deaminase [Clostridia bacterium]